MNLDTVSENIRTMEEAVKDAAVPDKQTEESVEDELLTEVASGAYYKNIWIMDEEVASASVTDQQNKQSVETEVLPKKNINAPED